MANSTNNKDNTGKNGKTSGGKITVSREINKTGAKKSGAGRSVPASDGAKRSSGSSANRSASVSGGEKKSSTGRSASVSNAHKSSTGRSASVSNAQKSSAGRSASVSDAHKSSAGRSVPAADRAKKSNSGHSKSASDENKSSNNKITVSRNNNGRSMSGANKNETGMSRKNKAEKQQKAKKLILAAELIGILIFVVIGISYFMTHKGKDLAVDVFTEIESQGVEIRVDGMDISQMTKEQAKQALMNRHPWKLTVSFDGQTYEAENYIEKEIDAVLYDAYASHSSADYEVVLADPDTVASGIAKTVSDMWSQPAVDATITGYDSESGEFVLSDSQPGHIIDIEKLTEDISAQLAAGNYTAVVEADSKSIDPNFEKADYKILGTYKTTTTSNENRNTNIRIASETICGTILQPQEQFSYNSILGKRTAEKGYKEAGAYANGEHVLEIGGGICQVSSTIYNATVFAGLQIDQRTGHTYEPSYVTPGEDAAVSYSTPDFVFTNNSGATLGIKTTFQDRTIVATIFGVSILPEGVTQYMRSEKIGEIDPPPDQIVEDIAVPPGQALPVSGPKNGSKWATYIIQEKDGEIIKEEYYHTTTYRGTAGVIHVNNSNVYDPTGSQTAQQQAAAQQAAQQQAAQQQEQLEAAQRAQEEAQQAAQQQTQQDDAAQPGE